MAATMATGFKRLKYPILFLIPPLLFLGTFYFYPLIKIVHLSFFSQGPWNSASLKTLFAAPFFLKMIWFTTWQAAVSTLLTFIFALPGAFIFARYDFFGKPFFRSLFTLPFVLPTVVVAAGFDALLAPRGLINGALAAGLGLSGPLINLEGSIWIILAAHVFYNYAIVLRLTGGFLENIEPEIFEAAQSLGASPLKLFASIVFPILKPVLAASGLLVFIFCFSSFGVILLLGGTRFATIEVEIHRQAVHIFNLPAAAALSLIQIAFTFGIMWLYARIQRRHAIPLNPKPRLSRGRGHVPTTQKTAGERAMIAGHLMFTSIFLGAPLLALLVGSLSGGNGLSFDFYRALGENRVDSVFFAPPLESVAISVKFALAATVMAVGLGIPGALFLSRTRGFLTAFFDPIFMLPLSTSAVTLGFGFIIAFDHPPLNLRNSAALIPAVHCLVAFPFVIRTLLPAIRGVPNIFRDAATTLGAPPLATWRAVDLPIIRRAVFTAAVFAFTISMGEFGAASFIARPGAPTIPVAIYRFLGQPGAMNYGQAMAMSCALMAATAAGFIFLDKTGSSRIGGL